MHLCEIRSDILFWLEAGVARSFKLRLASFSCNVAVMNSAFLLSCLDKLQGYFG